jgi:hypothetical protein
MRANGRKRKKLIPLANHEKPKITIIGVNSFIEIVFNRTGIDLARGAGGGADLCHHLAARGKARSQQQELAAVDDHVCFFIADKFNTQKPD